MSRSLRSRRLASAVLLVVLAPCPAARAADAAYFPDDTEMVVVVNLKQILACEMIKAQPDALGELKAVLGDFAGVDAVQKYLKEVGLDAFRDVRSISYAFAGGKEPGMRFLVLEGEFDAGKMTAAAKGGGAAVRAATAGGETSYTITPKGERPFFATLINRSTLFAAASEESLAGARARAAGTKPSGLKKELRKAVESIGERQSVAFASSGNGLARRLADFPVQNGETAGAFLQTLDALSGGLTLAKGIQFQLAANADSEETAKKLAESAGGALRILLTHARQTAEKDRAYLPVVDVVAGLRVTSQGTGVMLRGEVTLDTVERLMTSFPVSKPAKDRR